MTLQDQLDRIRERGEATRPLERTIAFKRAIAELKAAGIEQRVLGPGSVMPAFTLLNSAGQPVNSQELLTQGPLVVTFYRGKW